ncbi:alpha/beta hydrolase [Micromonospora humi]|uniref:Alpha/beta hydrolase fold n=1 Tax=Micromonospora humi TaxID=745366 RepID=A0A1C5JP57_9ACTN|nr:alpha/beta hydrolase [Micromonospora humi]SCG72297.1 alpha/beta hydrolase fold [Micromonospora humi]
MTLFDPGPPVDSSAPPAPRRATARVGAAAGAAAVLALVTACTGTPNSAESEPQPSAAGLEVFYGQKLSFGSCAGYGTTPGQQKLYVAPFECARLTVPLDYRNPKGRTIQVAVLRLPAQGDPGQRIGSLVLNPGGPGGSGLAQATSFSAAHAKSPLRQRFDVVGFDPRGVGSSTPAISCFTDAERDRGEDRTTLLASSGQWSEEDTRRLAERCAKGSGGADVLAAVGTRNTARDMDVLRSALGDEKLTYAGQSYGTRLGAVYAEMFGRNVRALVLDGVTDPTLENPQRRLTQQAGFQQSFEKLVASCVPSRDCPLGTDPARATEVFQKLVRPLIDKPVPAGEGRTLNFNQATGGVTAGLYYPEAWPTLIKGLAQLKQGDGTQLLKVGDVFGGRDASGVWDNFLEANLAVNCNDEVRRTPEEEARLRADIARTSPFVATGRNVDGVTRDPCESWPGEPSLGIPYAQDVEGLPDTLIISVTGDPATPYAAGKVLADEIGGTVLTVEGARHTVAQERVSPCVDAAFVAYLIEVKVPAEDRHCRL